MEAVHLGGIRVWLHTSHGLLAEGFTRSVSAPSITIDSHLWEGGSHNQWGTPLHPCSVTLGLPKPEVWSSSLGPWESWQDFLTPA